MTCPKCKGKLRCIGTVMYDKENEIFRKKECENCWEQFYTVEFTVEENDRFKHEWYEAQRDYRIKKSRE